MTPTHIERSRTFSSIELAMAADHGYAMPLPDGPGVAAIRREASVSTTQLAAAVGVSARTMENYEHGRTAAFGSPAIALRLGRVLNMLTHAVSVREASTVQDDLYELVAA